MENSLLALFVIGLVLVSMGPKWFGNAHKAAGFALTMKQLLPVAAAGGVAYVVLSSRDTEGKGINYVFAFGRASNPTDTKSMEYIMESGIEGLFNVLELQDDKESFQNLNKLVFRLKHFDLRGNAMYVEQSVHPKVKIEDPLVGVYMKGPVDRVLVENELKVLGERISKSAPKILVNETNLVVFDISHWELVL